MNVNVNKKTGKPYKQVCGLSFDLELIDKIDVARGKTPRSVFVRNILAEYFRINQEGQ